MTENPQPTGAQRLIGDFASKLITLTDYAGWPRAMSAITVAKQVFAS